LKLDWFLFCAGECFGVRHWYARYMHLKLYNFILRFI
jgi:hypothetical protein